MITIDIQCKKRKKKYLFAENWNEIPNGKFIRYFHYFIYLYNINNDNTLKDDLKKKVISELRYKLIPALSNIPDKLLLKLETFQVNYIFNLTSFLNENSDLFRIILNNFRLNFKKYYAPKDKFANLTFGEFIYADTYFINYFNTKKVEYLDNLIACLYRTKDRSNLNQGDIRKTFNSNLLHQDAKLFKKLSLVKKQIILFNYASIRNFIADTYKSVFDRQSDADCLEQIATIHGWDDFIKNISSNVFEIKQYSEENLHNVLSYLNTKIENNKK